MKIITSVISIKEQNLAHKSIGKWFLRKRGFPGVQPGDFPRGLGG
ncbi:hypothetical protein [Nostoc sp. WHI]|nr:hypothetical protein [Nostoc sp. WHI]